MNTSAGSDCPKFSRRGEKQSIQRKAIHDIVVSNLPDIVFFQEFMWTNTNGGKWKDDALPDVYSQLSSGKNRIVINTTRVQEKLVIPQNVINSFDPKPTPIQIGHKRYTVRILKVDNKRDIICMSWHGPHKVKNKRMYFVKLMGFVAKIQNEYNFPMIVAGDFNVDKDEVSDLIKPPFILTDCDEPRQRRNKKAKKN